MSIWGTTQMHLRNPYVIALWSAIFPGFGHLLLSKYVRGFLFFTWEIVINLNAHLNESILYSFTFHFDAAKQVLDTRWLILYAPTYLFAIWDSYRTAVDLNNQFELAVGEDAKVSPFVMHPLGINYLDKSSPRAAFFWSMTSPGVGQLIPHRFVVAFFILVWWIVFVYRADLLPAIHYTLLGKFDLARAVADHQWLLNIPSLYFFSIYDAYVNTVESNKLFDWEQAKYLKKEYQCGSFSMPFIRKETQDENMYIVSTFEHGIKLEAAISAIEMKGIPKEDILAIPLSRSHEDRMLFDRMHYSDSMSLFDLTMILATTFAVLGLIYGFLLYWGPVIWALIGTAAGAGTGLLIKLYINRKHLKKMTTQSPSVVLLIACQKNKMDMVQELLWANFALGVSKLDFDGEK